MLEARKAEWFIRKHNFNVDFQLRPIVLPKEQCDSYDPPLPRIPLNENDRRNRDFAERHGETGRVELDALEALRPGDLRKIVIAEVERYFDPNLQDRFEGVRRGVQTVLDEITADVRGEYAEALAAHQAEHDQLAWAANELRTRTQMVLSKMTAAMTARADVVGAMHPLLNFDAAEGFHANEDSDPLYDSGRTYLEQIVRYKRHQKRDADWATRRRARRAAHAREVRAKQKGRSA